MPSPIEVPRLLAVDDDEKWRKILERQLGKVEGDHLVVPDFSTGMQQIETELFAGVISDGLNGKWPPLRGRSHSFDMGFVLLSGDEDEISRARQHDIHAFHKLEVQRSPQLFGDIVGILLQ